MLWESPTLTTFVNYQILSTIIHRHSDNHSWLIRRWSYKQLVDWSRSLWTVDCWQRVDSWQVLSTIRPPMSGQVWGWWVWTWGFNVSCYCCPHSTVPSHTPVVSCPHTPSVVPGSVVGTTPNTTTGCFLSSVPCRVFPVLRSFCGSHTLCLPSPTDLSFKKI